MDISKIKDLWKPNLRNLKAGIDWWNSKAEKFSVKELPTAENSSQTGNTEKMAGVVRDGILDADKNIEVLLMNIADEENINQEFLRASSAVIFGTPCYVATTCWQMKKFFDTRFDCKLEGKLAACFATAGCLWGGPDIALQSILGMALTRGMLAYSSGTEFGRPYIHLGPVALMAALDEQADLFKLFGNRVAQKTLELFNK